VVGPLGAQTDTASVRKPDTALLVIVWRGPSAPRAARSARPVSLTIQPAVERNIAAIFR